MAAHEAAASEDCNRGRGRKNCGAEAFAPAPLRFRADYWLVFTAMAALARGHEPEQPFGQLAEQTPAFAA